MNPRPEKERLLDDVLGGDDTGFRESLFGETLRVARRRRAVRRLGRGAFALALILGVACVWLRNIPPRQTPPMAEKKLYEVVTSQPLPARELVTTQPLAASEIVISLPSIHVVQTADYRAPLPEIDDQQLLALLGSTPAALVRDKEHGAQLVFVNPADKERFLKN